MLAASFALVYAVGAVLVIAGIGPMHNFLRQNCAFSGSYASSERAWRMASNLYATVYIALAVLSLALAHGFAQAGWISR